MIVDLRTLKMGYLNYYVNLNALYFYSIQNDKLTPLDCALPYGHAEAAALIQGAGGQPYSYFSPPKDKQPEEEAAKNTNDSAVEEQEIAALSVEEKKPLLKKQIAFDAETKPLPEKQAAFDTESETTQLVQIKPSVDATEEEQHDAATGNQVSLLAAESTGQSVDDDNETVKEPATVVPKDQDISHSDAVAVIQSSGKVSTGMQKSLERPERFRSDSSLFSRAISFLRGQEQKPTTMVASAVALYGAQATILAGAIIGSPLGRKAMEVGEKVAKNAADDLIDEASQLQKTLPALLWEESRTPTPSPTPTPPATPSPEPVKAPSPVVVDIDPLERRIRKARAQLDTKKTPAFLAIQELLKVKCLQMREHVYMLPCYCVGRSNTCQTNKAVRVCKT